MQPAASFQHFAPMNSSQTQTRGTRNTWRRAVVTPTLSLLVAFSLLPVAAQVRGQKRITSVWTSTTAEGSRVHVVSDTPVDDYEGYTRGGRFYVKIPLADPPSATGSLLGRGFDDALIQRYGDGIIISFHLQPGTSARVAQASNRLEIVFTTPAGSRSGVAAGVRDADDANRTSATRIADLPSSSPSSSSSSSGEGSELRPSSQRVPRTVPAERQPANTGSASGTSPTSGTKGGSPAASPTATTSGLSASASLARTPVSPATPAPSQPSAAATPNKAANGKDNDWRSRAHYWKVWAELNWVPLLVGGLISLVLLVVLFFWRGAKRARDHGEESVAEPTEASSETVLSREASRNASRETPPPMRANEPAPATGAATLATGAGQSQAVAQTHSSNAPTNQQEKHGSEEQEREVFEL
jgi:hypothetical protein